MTPDLNTTWVDEESLPEGRVMGNMIVRFTLREHQALSTYCLFR